ncbi:MAG: hypothetical protein ISN29_02490 [Gammaproteobacteria bacterium AqS3]|nr:hypothetical protein [Gammaproteobacteria bacterium AqS3]
MVNEGINNNYRYEIIMFWDTVDDWLLWKEFVDLEDAKSRFDSAIERWENIPIMLYDRWSEKVVEWREE